MLRLKGFVPKQEFKKCEICQGSFDKNSMIRVANKYFCSNCVKYLNSYSRRNGESIATEKDKYFFGIELEFNEISEKLSAILLYYKFLLCYDGSVGFGEFKSPKLGYSKFKYILGNIYKKMESNSELHHRLVSSHIHFSYKDSNNTYNLLDKWDSIKRYFSIKKSKFVSAINRNYKLFGRGFTSYAGLSDPSERYFFIQNSRGRTLEFRLCKVTNYIQFKYITRFIITFCNTLLKLDYSSSEKLYKSFDSKIAKIYKHYNEKYITERGL